jgi:hypothetical protein
VDKLKFKLTSNHVLWAIYLALLATMLPHTAWVFAQFESTAPGLLGWEWGKAVAWTAAFAFEAAIAVFTNKLKTHNEKVPRYQKNPTLRKFSYRYLNPFTIALIIALSYSALTNFTHAVQFQRPLNVISDYSIPPWIYSVTFGAILPLCALVFALALSTSTDTESNRDEELAVAKKTERAANKEAAQLRKDLEEANTRFDTAELEFAFLSAPLAKDRIKGAHQHWPELTNKGTAIVAKASQAYASEVINRNGTGEE